MATLRLAILMTICLIGFIRANPLVDPAENHAIKPEEAQMVKQDETTPAPAPAVDEKARAAAPPVESQPDTKAAPSNQSGAAAPAVDAVKSDSIDVHAFQCYTCSIKDSVANPKICEKPTKLETCNAGEKQCFYIVGDVVENGKRAKNVVLAGCGTSPPLTLPGSQETFVHTAHTENVCRAVDFSHKDVGEAPNKADYTVSFKGRACNCDKAKCNADYVKYFDGNAGTTISPTIGLSLYFDGNAGTTISPTIGLSLLLMIVAARVEL